MRRILKIAQREYAETVKTKTFIIRILMTPVVIGLIIFFSERMARDAAGSAQPRRVALTDLSNELGDEIRSSFSDHNTSRPDRQITLDQIPATEADADEVARRQKERVRRGQIEAYVVLDRDVVKGPGMIRAYTHGSKMALEGLVGTVNHLVNKVVVDRRCRSENIDPDLLARLRRPVPAQRVDIGAEADEERVHDAREQIGSMMVPFFFLFLMFMGIFGMGQHMLTSVIEEKSSRVIEMLLSAVTPFQLMTGKIVGLAGVGLTVVTLWSAAALGAARWQELHVEVSAGMLAWLAIYYALGFLLFSSILAGIGSTCNTLKEAQSLMMPISLLVVIPMLAWMNLAQNPFGTLARVLSFIPPVTPMVMALRLAAAPDMPLLEILATIAVLAASVPVVMWAAAKVFRIGILMYGKRPHLREILRWVGES